MCCMCTRFASISTVIAYVTINSNKIASNRKVYGSGRGSNPEVTRKLNVCARVYVCEVLKYIYFDTLTRKTVIMFLV